MKNPQELLAKKPLFDQYVGLRQYQLSSYHFSSIFLWQDFFDFEFEVIQESLCVFAHNPKASFLYLPPLSKELNPSVVQECFLKMNKVNPKTARIENIEEDRLKSTGLPYKFYEKSKEYVYLKQDLIDLKGHAYKSQRHDIHHFQAHHQGAFRPLEEGDIIPALKLYEIWAKNRWDKHEDPVYRQMLRENRIVHELALRFYKQLGLVGFIVEIDKKLAAYSLGYSLNSETFCVLLEVSDLKVVGLSSFIFNRVCSHEAFKDHALVNTMDDFGLPFVAASKQAYHPALKPVSYTITL